MYPVSDEFLRALRGSHEIAIRVEIRRPRVTTGSPLPDAVTFRGGSEPFATSGDLYGWTSDDEDGVRDLYVVDGLVTVTEDALVRRTIDLTLSAREEDRAALYSISELWDEIAVERGIVFDNGRIEFVPLGVFRVDRVARDLDREGVVQVKGSDAFVRVVEAQFEQPNRASTFLTMTENLDTLLDFLPRVPAYGDVEERPDEDPYPPAGVIWETDRAAAVRSLAASVGVEVFVGADGYRAMRAPSSFEDPAVWRVDAGGSGVLLGGGFERTRDGLYSVVVASSSTTDGSAPVYGIAEDVTLGSPTNVLTFGRVVRRYSSPLLRTTAQAEAAASTILAKSRGRARSLTLDSLVNPALDAGDRIDVVFPDGTVERHIVSTLAIPLGPSGALAITTRALPPGGTVAEEEVPSG